MSETVKKSKKKLKKKVIGRLEYINIPDLNLNKISAKIDTGAYTGAIHAENIEEIERDGEKFLTFTILDSEHPEYEDVMYEISDYRMKKVKSSSASGYEERFMILVSIEIAGETLEAELSLTDRKGMRVPILIGRKPLKKRFIIDTSKKYTH